ncbi:hypothetical protein LWI29_004158 [Acer saccharum]|uniref:F-box domain-containing protein n=1 Tax=Acer saccharum TaxID=4024 RepID=A0AA39S278_ACESA|nr:hypothetical protein LWI29_004158 [Acer saccharum]
MDSIVVWDNGAGYVKCGFAGENFPTSVFPCVVGRPMLRYKESLMEQELKVHSFSTLVVMSGMLALPEGCIAAVISFTTPRDACSLACVSTIFRSAADSDVVWDCFLRPISLPRSVSSLSKKELYLRTGHNLIHNDKLSFWFDLPSGKKCYMISPRELNIVDYDPPFLWQWHSIPLAQHYFGIPDGRFPEVLMRFDAARFQISGKISTSLLSPMTTYIVYLVFAEDLLTCADYDPVEVDVGLAGSSNCKNRIVYLHRVHLEGDDDGVFPKKRTDGWLESELGEFFNGDNEEGELLMTINTEMKEHLLVQGIEIRPKKE